MLYHFCLHILADLVIRIRASSPFHCEAIHVYSSLSLSLFTSHSTVVVNALTPEDITCYYPALTFENKNQSLNAALNERTWSLIHEKWARRGFRPIYGTAQRHMTDRLIDMGLTTFAPQPFRCAVVPSSSTGLMSCRRLPCNLFGSEKESAMTDFCRVSSFALILD